MADSYFEILRSYFHTFSRAFTMKNQDFVDQAPLKAGHNISTDSIRTDEIPYFTYDMNVPGDYDIQIQQLVTGTTGNRVIKYEYNKILKFYDGVELTVKENTNGETYQLIDPDTGNVVTGFIDPTDKFDETGEHTADIYQMSLLDEAGNKIPAANGQTWTFDTFNGTVQFANGETPASHPKWGKIKIRAFAYVGKKLSTTISEITNTLNSDIDDLNNSNLSVYKEIFQFSEMTKVENNYEKTVSGFLICVKDSDGLMIGDVSYNNDGSSKVIFEDFDSMLEEKYQNSTFTAYIFKTKGNDLIELLPPEIIEIISSSSSSNSSEESNSSSSSLSSLLSSSSSLQSSESSNSSETSLSSETSSSSNSSISSESSDTSSSSSASSEGSYSSNSSIVPEPSGSSESNSSYSSNSSASSQEPSSSQSSSSESSFSSISSASSESSYQSSESSKTSESSMTSDSSTGSSGSDGSDSSGEGGGGSGEDGGGSGGGGSGGEGASSEGEDIGPVTPDGIPVVYRNIIGCYYNTDGTNNCDRMMFGPLACRETDHNTIYVKRGFITTIGRKYYITYPYNSGPYVIYNALDQSTYESYNAARNALTSAGYFDETGMTLEGRLKVKQVCNCEEFALVTACFYKEVTDSEGQTERVIICPDSKSEQASRMSKAKVYGRSIITDETGEDILTLGQEEPVGLLSALGFNPPADTIVGVIKTTSYTWSTDGEGNIINEITYSDDESDIDSALSMLSTEAKAKKVLANCDCSNYVNVVICNYTTQENGEEIIPCPGTDGEAISKISTLPLNVNGTKVLYNGKWCPIGEKFDFDQIATGDRFSN